MSNIDAFESNCEGLYGPPYYYTGERSGESYESTANRTAWIAPGC